MKLYVVVDIGCLECGESSRVVLVTAHQEYADKVCEREQELYDAKRRAFNHELFVQEVELECETDPESGD